MYTGIRDNDLIIRVGDRAMKMDSEVRRIIFLFICSKLVKCIF